MSHGDITDTVSKLYTYDRAPQNRKVYFRVFTGTTKAKLRMHT